MKKARWIYVERIRLGRWVGWALHIKRYRIIWNKWIYVIKVPCLFLLIPATALVA